ncbi:hypothetical protein [Flavobacterium sp.]|uniref:hypothetical protein n=1 Tax=Flavobacterium sp. TaxID=239 RepID=UPI0028BED411|nr:hypothetical protein [Flavobacterium sp.]
MSAVLVVIIGLIGVLLGYIIGKSGGFGKNGLADLVTELDHKKQRINELELELNSFKSKNDSSSHILGFTSNEPIHADFDSELASSVIGKKVEENDLKVIEGIGPKIEELFKSSGIMSWKRLSETSVDRCNEILMKAGDRFAFHNPTTWPRQARLAYEGKWRDLKVWQDSLVGGIE